MFYCHKSAGAVGGTAEHNKEEKWEIFPFFPRLPKFREVQKRSSSSELILSIIHKYVLRAAKILSTNIQQFVKCSSPQKSYTIAIKQLSAFLWVFQCFGFVWVCLFGFVFSISNKARKFHHKKYNSIQNTQWSTVRKWAADRQSLLWLRGNIYLLVRKACLQSYVSTEGEC